MTGREPNPNREQVPVPKGTVTLSLMESAQCNQPATWQLAPAPEFLTALNGTAGHSVDQVKILRVLRHFPSHSTSNLPAGTTVSTFKMAPKSDFFSSTSASVTLIQAIIVSPGPLQ